MKEVLLNDNYFSSIDCSILINKIVSEASIRKDLVLLNYDWVKYLKKYLILTYAVDKIPPLPIDILYTNRYYLLEKFYYYYQIYFGKDAGIEQQINLIIEDIYNHLNGYDFHLLEKISNEIKSNNI